MSKELLTETELRNIEAMLTNIFNQIEWPNQRWQPLNTKESIFLTCHVCDPPNNIDTMHEAKYRKGRGSYTMNLCEIHKDYWPSDRGRGEFTVLGSYDEWMATKDCLLVPITELDKYALYVYQLTSILGYTISERMAYYSEHRRLSSMHN